ncbi:MAG: YceI family protein [Gammaproteobacteria bacterium]|nr:YceI family protein [Gammaproteobacteria bacterium]
MRYLFLLSFVILDTGVALADDWVMDRAASRLEFVADYVGADVPGRFDRFDVTLSFDPSRPAAGRLEVSVDVSSADMGDADLTATVVDKPWFDAATFAVARFTSDELDAHDAGGFVARGTLELKGVMRDVTVPFAWQRSGDGATMRGEVVLSRLDFGIGVAVEEVGAEVRVAFEIALRQE